MIVLREAAEDLTPDPVLDAAFALAEAAAASESSYSPELLAVYAQGAAMSLSEAGGLFSWIKRHYLAHDSSAAPEMRKEIEHGVRDEEHRKELIAHCDKLIHEAEHSWHVGSGMVLGTAARAGAAMVGGPVTAIGNLHWLVGVVGRTAARSTGAVRKYIEAVKAVRSEIEKAPVAKKED
jgi:hypothetical protein